MIYTEMRSARSWRGRTTASLGAGLLLLAGCGGSEPAVESAASPAPQEITAETFVEATTPPAPTSSPDPSTTDEATTAIPDPSDIDVAYMQEVADVFAHREGEILRTVVSDGTYTDKLHQLIQESAGGTYLNLSVSGYKQVLSDGSYRDRYEDRPLDPSWIVSSVDPSHFPCVSVLVHVDVSSTRRGGPFEPRPTLMAFRQQTTPNTFSAWRLDRMAVGSDLEAVNACELD